MKPNNCYPFAASVDGPMFLESATAAKAALNAYKAFADPKGSLSDSELLTDLFSDIGHLLMFCGYRPTEVRNLLQLAVDRNHSSAELLDGLHVDPKSPSCPPFESLDAALAREPWEAMLRKWREECLKPRLEERASELGFPPGSEAIVLCGLCGYPVWFNDSWSPGDDAICTRCDTEVTGREHPPRINPLLQDPPADVYPEEKYPWLKKTK